MKIRIANNVIRFRLKQPEVHYFSEHQNIREVLEFGALPGEKLCFALQTSTSAEFSIAYHNNTIVLHIPQQFVQEWTLSELVGFEKDVRTVDGKTIKILVEKDFACLDKTVEENEGSYAHPKANC